MIYEQPLNEQVRLCLRLEYLLAQIDHYLNGESIWDAHQVLRTMVEILQTIDRPDLKNKFFQNLNQYLQLLSQLEGVKEVDKKKLNGTLKQIEYLIDSLHTNQKKIGQELRNNEFLAAIQQRLYTPAGTCGFSLPAYQLWLRQKDSVRRQHLANWLSQLAQLREIVEITLKLTRESTLFREVEAQDGFYQCNLDPGVGYQMIRIEVPASRNVFPEISVGRYRLTIHFFNLDVTGRHLQLQDGLEFGLACCKL